MSQANKKHIVVRKLALQGVATHYCYHHLIPCLQPRKHDKQGSRRSFLQHFYGTKGDDYVSYLHMFVTGHGIFAKMFEGSPDNEARKSKVLVLVKQINKTVLQLVNTKQGSPEVLLLAGGPIFRPLRERA
jgi:hypothetical protein